MKFDRNVKQLIMERVLVGKACTSTPDMKLKMPPLNEETKQRYDSVKGSVDFSAKHWV
jgi:hypothetical protein